MNAGTRLQASFRFNLRTNQHRNHRARDPYGRWGGERVQSRSSAGHAQLFVANSSLTRMCANLWILVVGLASRRPSGSVCPDAFAQRIRLLPQAFYHRAER